MKRVVVASIVFLFASVTLVTMLAGPAHAAPTPSPTPVPISALGLGLGTCYLNGTADLLTPTLDITNTKSCVGVAPPPSPGVNCNPRGLESSTLDVEHDVRDRVDIGGFGTLYLFYSLGCGSVWAALKVDTGCHAITSITITDSHDGATQGGLDPNGVLKCGPSWESSYMVDGEAGSTATASVNVDFVNYPSASVTV